MIYTIHNTAAVGKPCRVFVNGNEIKHVTYADTTKGIVRYLPEPWRIKTNGEELYERKLKGKVVVEIIDKSY